MELRKFTLVIFLNDGPDVEVTPDGPNDKTGSLRLYAEGDTFEGVVDIHPRVGRAVLFKSEHLLHRVNPIVGQDNFFLTSYFTQVVDKPAKPHPIPNDWSIFISIASYRDPQLTATLKSLVRLAAHPERLRINILNQYNPEDESDVRSLNEVKAYLAEVGQLPNAPSILQEELHSKYAMGSYMARAHIQKHYQDETYQLQLDSHHRFYGNWDTKLIEQLHSCDAGEYSVLTSVTRPYLTEDPLNSNAKTYFVDGPVQLITQKNWNADGMPSWASRPLEKHQDAMTRPVETMLASAHFTFSHGHLLKVAGHDEMQEYQLAWEELWMAYMYWKQGYTLYSPVEAVVYHSYDNSYRNLFINDALA